VSVCRMSMSSVPGSSSDEPEEVRGIRYLSVVYL
jgi:hypothetical protein